MFRKLPTYEHTTRNPYWSAYVPSHWRQEPGLAVLQENRHKNHGLGENQVLSLSYGQVIVKPVEKQRGLVPESYEGYQILDPGDIVVRPTDLQNDQTSIRVGHVKDRGIITSAYIGLRSRGEWSDAYAYQYLSVVDSSKRIYGMGSGLRQQLGWADLKRLPCLVPPGEEQAAIVKYLAQADARIGRAVAAKRRLIALLEDQKRAVVALVLTRGGRWDPLANGGRRREIAQVSIGGEFVRAGRLCRISTGVEDSGNAAPEGEFPFFVRGREVLRSTDYLMDAEAVLTPGDGQGGVGKVFHYVNGKFQAHQRVYIFHDFNRVRARYFYWYLSTFFRPFALSRSNTVTMESLRRPVLAEFPVLVPSAGEQSRLVDEIESATARISRQQGIAHREIQLIREFRTRLVSDVVTGQVDVRTMAASLPGVPEVIDSLVSEPDDELEEALGESED